MPRYGERIKNWPCGRCKQNSYLHGGVDTRIGVGTVMEFVCVNCGHVENFKQSWFDKQNAEREAAKAEEQAQEDNIPGDEEAIPSETDQGTT